MKKLFLAFSLMLALVLVGCSSGSSEPKVKDIPVDDIKAVVNTEALLPAQPTAELPASEYYALESVKDKFSEGFVLKAMLSTNYQDVFVVKANTEEDVEAIKAVFEDYKTNDTNVKMFANGYGNADNIDIAANTIIGSQGNYVYFIAAKDSAAVETAILDTILEK